MKIKKPANGGGAAIADRFKLEPVETKKNSAGTVGKTSVTVAFIFGLVAFVVSGLLTYTIWKHWEFLMPA